MNGDPIEFKIDTGADVIVIPATVNRESRDDKLQPAGKELRGPSQHTLTVLGKFQSALQSASATALQDIYIVKGLQKALLGRPAIEALAVAVRVDQILDNKATITARYPKLLNGLGCMRGAYQIQLKYHAVPFALTVP